MTVINRDSSVTDFDLRRIVQAIEKAIGEDVPRQLKENHLETNNYVALMRGDFINDNLRNYALEEGVELLPFQRFGWKGRLIVDRRNRITLSVTTQNNLRAIPRKQRSRPHYTMSLLKMQNRMVLPLSLSSVVMIPIQMLLHWQSTWQHRIQAFR